MSAFVVSREHVDVLLRVALEGPRDRGPRYGGDGWGFRYWTTPDASERFGFASHDVELGTADEIGRMLWTENVASVAARYPQDGPNDRPGPNGFCDAEAESYTYRRPQVRLSAVEALKALDCYEYQSCEHDGWRASSARAFCRTLRACLIGALSGYRDAPWEWTSVEVELRAGERVS